MLYIFILVKSDSPLVCFHFKMKCLILIIILKFVGALILHLKHVHLYKNVKEHQINDKPIQRCLFYETNYYLKINMIKSFFKNPWHYLLDRKEKKRNGLTLTYHDDGILFFNFVPLMIFIWSFTSIKPYFLFKRFQVDMSTSREDF